MYHSLFLGDKNTYDDFGLIPTSRPVISPPEPRTSYIEIPGRSGLVDLTESLTGKVSFDNRSGSIEFLVPRERNWTEIYSELLSFIQGKHLRVILEDDPHFYYEGRLSISDWNSGKNNSTINLNYDLSPFKYELDGTTEGYIVSSRTFQSGYETIYAKTDTKILEMIITCTAASNLNITATIDGVSYQCKAGENILPVLRTEGTGGIKVGGVGNVTIKYRRGRL